MSLANPAIRAKTLHYDYKMLLAKPVYSKKPCKASVQTPIMTPTIDPNLITGLKAMDRRACRPDASQTQRATYVR
ncbi:MAG: hypothetical protein CMG97_10520 [Marinovum sp.]|nr:hypothetical protein [Marinovum sp.]